MSIIKYSSLVLLTFISSLCIAQTPIGSVQEGPSVHTPESQLALVQQARVALPAHITGDKIFVGLFKDIPQTTSKKAPVIVFMHGSSGLALPAIEQWQRWLAQLGYASIAPDSFALAKRLTYKSPVDVATYERIHELRLSEIAPTVEALKSRS